jgi:transcriptional regulator with XRE-family HTH domain
VEEARLVRVVCHLRELRGKRTLAELAEASGVAAAVLSQLERGIMLPRGEWLYGLGMAYGAPPTKWYSELALLAIQEDEEDR